jgi:hypothetical protein
MRKFCSCPNLVNMSEFSIRALRPEGTMPLLEHVGVRLSILLVVGIAFVGLTGFKSNVSGVWTDHVANLWSSSRGSATRSVSAAPKRSPEPAVSASPTEHMVTASGLAAIAARSSRPIYWAGGRGGTTGYRASADGRVYLRYVPRGAGVSATRQDLTLGTYPLKNAYATIRALSHGTGAVEVKVAKGGGVAFYLKQHPTSVYLAYPGTNAQVEVFSPNAGVARKLVARGGVTPVG